MNKFLLVHKWCSEGFRAIIVYHITVFPTRGCTEIFRDAFRVSADTIREVVGLYRAESTAFARKSEPGPDADSRASTVCVMADGTGMPMRRECLKGARGRDGRARRGKSRRAPSSSRRRPATTNRTATSTRRHTCRRRTGAKSSANTSAPNSTDASGGCRRPSST